MIARATRIVLALACIGCGGETATPELPAELPPAPVVATAGPTRAADAIYDERGEVLESAESVAGLRLPRGLEMVYERDRRHVYRSEVPLEKMQRYFGVRLVTGQVDSRPSGSATYVDAVPRDVRGGAVHLDVTVEPTSGAPTRVEIVERLPPPSAPPPQEESIRALEEAMRNAE